MSQTFRELVKPGTNFEFVGRRRGMFTLSILLVLASIAMLPINKMTRGSVLNWTIDFKGGTQIIFAFPEKVDSGQIRKALEGAGRTGVDVSSFGLDEEGVAAAYLVRLPEFGAVGEEEGVSIADQFSQKFKERDVIKARWSGDTFFVTTKQKMEEKELAEFLAAAGLEMRPWTEDQKLQYQTPVAGLGEYRYEVSIFGLDRELTKTLTDALGMEVKVKQVDAVGAKAGAALIEDAVKSLFYAILFILIYIAIRFDFRFGPGTVVALLHDAIVTIGVFAVAWTEVSLTTVAALLTVIGYSMNDTIVVFDRIRENETRLKDKKLDRVINISINETLSRTILTSGTTFVVTLAMNILGTGLVQNFAFAMNVGVLVGTYSSIFVAAPILLWLDEKFWSRRDLAAAEKKKRKKKTKPAEAS